MSLLALGNILRHNSFQSAQIEHELYQMNTIKLLTAPLLHVIMEQAVGSRCPELESHCLLSIRIDIEMLM